MAAFTKMGTIIKNNARYLSTNGGWLGFIQILTASSAILLSIVMANVITPEVYGQYRYFTSVLMLASALSLFGIKSPLAREITKGNEYVFFPGITLSLKWTGSITIIALAASAYYLIAGNSTLAVGFVLIGFLAPLYYTSQLYSAYLQGKTQFRALAVATSAQTLLPATLTGLTAYLSGDGLITFLAFISAQTLVSGLIFFITTKHIQRDVTDPNTVAETLRFGTRLSLAGIVSKISLELDKLVIFWLLGATELAVYAFALAIPRQLRTSQKMLSILSLPKFSTRSYADLKQGMLPKLCLVFLFTGILIWAYWCLAPYIFAWLFPQYEAAVIYSQYAALMLITIPTAFLKQALLVHTKEASLYLNDTAIPVTRIILLLILIPLYGLWGAVIALIAHSVLQLIYLLWAFYTIPE